MNRRIVASVVLLVASTLSTSVPAAAAVAPDTVIKKGPSGKVASTTVSFTFKAKPKAGATLQCRMDSGRWKKCKSPKTYVGLAQGSHTFSVRALKDGEKDKTPARRVFAVDTVAPTTAITDGPAAVTGDSTPTFAFSADEPATFSCRVGAASFAPCTSPHTTSAPLVDGSYAFEVRATDSVGNVGGPATRAFEVLTPITKDLPTMEQAAALWFPNSTVFDVPANCAGNPRIDCPDGVNPLPAEDQVGISSARTVTPTGDPDVYNLLVAADVATLPTTVVKLTVTSPVSATCDLTVDSSLGSTDGWTATMTQTFVDVAGETRIQAGTVSVTGVEANDMTIAGGGTCDIVNSGKSLYVDMLRNILTSELQEYIDAINPLCAAPGPAYLGPCP